MKKYKKLHWHIIFENVLMLLAWQNYQNQSVLVDAAACQIWRVIIET